MSEEKQEDKKPEQPAIRKIIIETDGNFVRMVSAEVAGHIELVAILERLLIAINQKMNGQ